jgi:YVTN family beta-propeller protein
MRAPAVSLSFVALAIAAACSSNPSPQSSPSSRQNGRMRGEPDTMPGNKVIENARPDVPLRAGLLVVANQEGASATVLDAATMQTIATVPVGVGPHEVAVSHDGRWAVVTNYGDRTTQGNTLSVIDLAAATPVVARTIDLGQYRRPHGVTFVGIGDKLAVTSESSQRLLIVDFASGRIDTALATNGRGSHMVAARRDGRRAWTANIQDGTVTEYDLDTRRTGRTYPAAPMDEGIAVTPGGVQVWVGSNTAHTVTVLDAARGTPVDTLTGFGMPYRIGISRTGTIAIINDPVNNRIWMYEVGSRKRLAEIDLATVNGVKTPTGGAPGSDGAGPEGVTFDPIANVAYVTLHGTNQVVAVDLRQRKVIGFGPVGAGPDGVAYSQYVRD